MIVAHFLSDSSTEQPPSLSCLTSGLSLRSLAPAEDTSVSFFPPQSVTRVGKKVSAADYFTPSGAVAGVGAAEL